MKGKAAGVVVLLMTGAVVCMAPAGGCGQKSEKRRVVLKVEKMTCGSCIQAVTHALKSTKGVISAKVTLEPPRAVVVFDSAKTGVKTLIRATTGIGYPSSVLKPGRTPKKAR